MSNDYATAVTAQVQQLRSAVRHVPGVGTMLTPAVLAEVIGLVDFVESELAGRSRRISDRLQALRAVLYDGSRVHATNGSGIGLCDLRFEPEVDTAATAEMLGLKEDTVRKALREKRIHGRRLAAGHWMVPLSAIAEYQRGSAA